jgi:hypothetical protein
MFPSTHLKTETDPVSEMFVILYLEFRALDKVQKPNGSVLYTIARTI